MTTKIEQPIETNYGMRIGIPGLGERLKKARKEAGYTQVNLADFLDVSWMTLHRWEKNERTITYGKLVMFARRCGVTQSSLLYPFDEFRTFIDRVEKLNSRFYVAAGSPTIVDTDHLKFKEIYQQLFKDIESAKGLN